jgi:type II secretory pathway pseudopilin PulG
MRPGSTSRSAEAGFTYLGVLLMVALLSIGLLAASEIWVTTARRQKLAELDWIGGQFVDAIGSYYESSPGSRKVYPSTLQDLLEDRRFLTMRRHLRTVYVNPLTLNKEWQTIPGPEGSIKGIVVMVSGEPVVKREYVYAPRVGAAMRVHP